MASGRPTGHGGLDALDVPRSSQVLVFSKTSAQFRWITPRNPRAIYFNDEVYVGWVPGAPLLEISTATASGGAQFYTLRQRPSSAPRFAKDDGSCLQCHESHRTLGVPGHLTRSVFPAPDGLPHFGHGTIDVDHATPISQRWGGWFVTGSLNMPHRGNAVGEESEFKTFSEGRLAMPFERHVDADRYLVPSSDVVAHLVLAHQTATHNAIALAAVEARKAMDYAAEMERLFGQSSESVSASVARRIERPAERLVRTLLLAGEAPLVGPVMGDSGFAEEFQAAGPADPASRSLRELDLRTRLFRLPCSFLIRSKAYRGLPLRVREYVARRIREVLSGRDEGMSFSHLSAADRARLAEVLN